MRRVLPIVAVSLLVFGTLMVFASSTPSPDATATANMLVAQRVVDGIATANVQTATAAGAVPTATSPAVASATPPPSATPSASPTATGTPTAGGTTFVVMMENTERSSIIGNTGAPYTSAFAAAHGQATGLDAVTHPSLPNRFADLTGSTQSVTDDNYYSLAVPNLFDAIHAAGKDWRQYNEDMPSACFASDSGEYVVHHNLPLNITDIIGNSTYCTPRDRDFSTLSADLSAGTTPAFVWIEPNNIHNGHDSDVQTQDTFLKGFIPQILASPAYKNGGHLLITWDEGETNVGGGGNIAVIAASPGDTARLDSRTLSGYSIERTLADLIGVAAPGAGATAPTLTALFAGGASSTAVPTSTAQATATATATATHGTQTFGDEFNGANVDTTKWNTKCDGATASDPSYCGGADQYFDASALSESGGALHITASPKAMFGHPYTSGIVWTKDKGFAQQFGYWEIRAKLPAGMGMWPAFWGIPNNGGPPEIDAFEMYAGTSTSTLDYTVHWPGCNSDSGCQKQGTSAPTGGDLTTGYHTYAVDWRTDHIIWYVDGVEQFRVTSAQAPIPQVAFVPIIEVQVGSDWNNQHGTGETAVMDVDYIRLYA